jgi:RimJ/RimL family protein N-acetyltransferase
MEANVLRNIGLGLGRTRASLSQLGIRISGRVGLGVYRRSLRYGLCRDLHTTIQNPTAKIPIAIRPMLPADLPLLLSPEQPNGRERLEATRRRAFADRRPTGCFVAVDQRDGTPCYMQWLLGPADNPFIRQMGGFPDLHDHEALLENAYTPIAYRGLGIMSAAMALLAEKADTFGADHVLTFVEHDNVASLKGCQKAGFFPHLLQCRLQIGYGLFARDRFELLAENDPRRTLSF